MRIWEESWKPSWGNRKLEIPVEDQGARKSGCRISEYQDIRKSGKERISKTDPLIS
jgi:hypothetical protein